MGALGIEELGHPWRVVFDEAWASFRSGNYGIGAALVDPGTGDVVSTGRNRVTEQQPASRTIGGNFLAHAEMNAFAAMEPFFARGLHLYTTLEPCLMCSATAIQLNVEHVHFAAHDEFFDDLDGLWQHHEYTRTRKPGRTGPLDEAIARFARLLPMTFTLAESPESNAAIAARRDTPELAAVAQRLATAPELAEVREADSVSDAYHAIASELASW
ncbi:nucleoside deaminase [Ilumatobacter coccineus]|uniref:Putative deaminase n=1 Tax=Ilumatobacter coccineus (strain NBRC 103263 / KCTC 29153 / YM16-304) TaxID=1313172 RepID=A0A6C7EGE5_ILUCY|nr:nucleoside deaminase [Ilumatobacter coccineus]BAN04199.1 putative deaminase [Ilumatobacter coccineus YM16-304]